MRHGRSLQQSLLSAFVALAAFSLPDPSALAGSKTLAEKSVAADALRWRDIEGELYSESFRSTFSYGSSGSVVVTWTDGEPILSGAVTATSLKPNFAYQVKLVGRVSITSATEAPDPDSEPEAWASWQIGKHGRWWDEDDEWNLSDSGLAGALAAGHSVVGYLLMDFFVTDSDGNATHPFSLDSTYHVLWRTDQRTPTSADSAVTYHDITRGSWGYDNDPAEEGNTVGVFAEGESGRAAPGTLIMPNGVYPVTLNITEESFHDNMGYPTITTSDGGFWAQVLEGDLIFEVWPLAVRWPRHACLGVGRATRGSGRWQLGWRPRPRVHQLQGRGQPVLSEPAERPGRRRGRGHGRGDQHGEHQSASRRLRFS